MPEFSVLVSVYKTEYLKQTLESLRLQSSKNFELVIIDDCSPGNVKKICADFPDLGIRYYKNESNLGKKDPSRSWNKGLEFCTQDYVCLVGDDDLLDLNYFKVMKTLVRENSGARLYRSRLRVIDNNNEIVAFGPGLPQEETWDEFLYQRNTNKRPHSTSEFCIHRQSLMDIGGWVAQPMAIGSDDLTYLELARKGGIVSTNKTWASWRRHRKQISTSRKFEFDRLKASKLIYAYERSFIRENNTIQVPKRLLIADLPGKRQSYFERVRGKALGYLGQIGFE